MEDEPEPDWKKPLVFGGLLLPLLIACTCLSLLTITYRQQIPYVQNYFPTKTASPPGILVNQPDKNVKITYEDFSTNQNNWSTRYILSKAEVKDGKLFLESFDKTSFAIGYCGSCSFVVHSNHTLQNPYYLQADFNTDQKVFEGTYGLVFNFLKTKKNYYTFTINPYYRYYELDKFQNGHWNYLSKEQSNLIKPYPETNTLSLDFEKDVIRLYINGQAVKDIIEKQPIEDGRIGVYMDSGGFKLMVDNLFAYHK